METIDWYGPGGNFTDIKRDANKLTNAQTQPKSHKFQLLVSTIDFRYITDVVTPAEAVAFLKQNAAGKEQREKELREVGYPCYTTQVGMTRL